MDMAMFTIFYINMEKQRNGFRKEKSIWFNLWIRMFSLLIAFLLQ